jgi:hypothetical protein
MRFYYSLRSSLRKEATRLLAGLLGKGYEFQVYEAQQKERQNAPIRHKPSALPLHHDELKLKDGNVLTGELIDNQIQAAIHRQESRSSTPAYPSQKMMPDDRYAIVIEIGKIIPDSINKSAGGFNLSNTGIEWLDELEWVADEVLRGLHAGSSQGVDILQGEADITVHVSDLEMGRRIMSRILKYLHLEQGCRAYCLEVRGDEYVDEVELPL